MDAKIKGNTTASITVDKSKKVDQADQEHSDKDGKTFIDLLIYSYDQKRPLQPTTAKAPRMISGHYRLTFPFDAILHPFPASVGDIIDALDVEANWRQAKITDMTRHSIKLQYTSGGDKDIWVSIDSNDIAPVGMFTAAES